MNERMRLVVSKRMIFIILYILVALGASFQSLLVEPKPNPENGITYTNYNN